MDLAIGVAVVGTALEGGRRSFESFYELHRRGVLALCYALADGVTAAEDIAQEAFVKTYLQWSKVSAMDHPGAWVRRVAVNLATSRRRRLAAEARALVRFGTEISTA